VARDGDDVDREAAGLLREVVVDDATEARCLRSDVREDSDAVRDDPDEVIEEGWEARITGTSSSRETGREIPRTRMPRLCGSQSSLLADHGDCLREVPRLLSFRDQYLGTQGVHLADPIVHAAALVAHLRALAYLTSTQYVLGELRPAAANP
jgi:hypothetical protein